MRRRRIPSLIPRIAGPAGVVLAASCAPDSIPLSLLSTTSLEIRATFAPGTSTAALAVIDRVQVTALRPLDEVVADTTVLVSSNQQSSITVDLTVELRAPEEQLTIRVALYSGELLAYAGAQAMTVDASRQTNVAPVIELLPVAPELTAFPGSLSASVVAGEAVNGSLEVGNVGGGVLRWTGSADVGWLTLSPDSDSVPAGATEVVTVTASAEQLAPGPYSAVVTLRDPEALGSPRNVDVSLMVIERPFILLGTTTLDFQTREQESPPTQLFDITNGGGGILSWRITDDATWLVTSPGSGTLAAGASQSVSVTLSTANLLPGTFPATITVTDTAASNSPQTVAVSVTITPRPTLALTPTTIDFGMTDVDPPLQSLIVTNNGPGALSWSATPSASWVGVSPRSGSLVAGQKTTLLVSASLSSLSVGVHSAVLSISSPDASNSPQNAAVIIEVIILGRHD